jgi:hypothetical protein
MDDTLARIEATIRDHLVAGAFRYVVMNDVPFPAAGTWLVMVEGPSIHFTIGAAVAISTQLSIRH